jgi:hypothetical protein
MKHRMPERLEYKPGDLIISENDGLEYEVVKFGSRNDLEPLPGVMLVGNALIVKSSNGDLHLLYEWEVSHK